MRCQGAAPLPSGGAALSGAPPQRVDRRALSALLGNFSVDRVVFRIDFLYHHVDDAGVRSGMFVRGFDDLTKHGPLLLAREKTLWNFAEQLRHWILRISLRVSLLGKTFDTSDQFIVATRLVVRIMLTGLAKIDASILVDDKHHVG